MLTGKNVVCAFVLFTALSWPAVLTAEPKNEVSKNLFEMSLEELLAIPATIASNKSKPVREQPGVVSLITEQQIVESGARNLQEILKQVPGLWITGELVGLKAMTFRGIGSVEGKILLIVDGIEKNDLLVGGVALNNRYVASTIKQIEIIRGPGSVIYGGQAALMVIKVTTKGPEQEGTQIDVTADFTNGNVHNNNYSITTGHELKNGLAYSLSAAFGHGDYANDAFNGILGNSVKLENNSNTRPLMVNSSLAYHDWEIRFIYDNYEWEDRLFVGGLGRFSGGSGPNAFTEFTTPGTLSFEAYAGSVAYSWQVNDELSIHPKLSYQHHTPFRQAYPDRENVAESVAERWTFNVNSIYEWSKTQNLLIGLNHYSENVQVKETLSGAAVTLFDGDDKGEVEDYALYLQYEAETSWANLTLGARYEHHSLGGDAFVPRIAVTKIWDRFHLKWMYSEAFRVPQSFTFHGAESAGAPILEVEETTNTEMELGYQVSDSLLLQSNFYWMEVDDFIGLDPATFRAIPQGDLSTWGAEFILQSRQKWGTLDISYSFYQLGSNDIDSIRVEADEDRVHGIANHKLALNVSYRLGDRASLNFNGVVLGTRYAQVGPDEAGKIDEEYDFNVFYRKEYSNWSLGAGVANLFNSSVRYTEPFRGFMGPIPGLGRRLMMNVGYQF